MSAGALVIASRTPPVEEVIEHGKNGLLVAFFDVEGLSESAIEALARRDKYARLQAAARQTIVERYDLRRICLPRWLKFVDSVARNPEG
jgi:glycosyltransferase involved in cell wall biosynthesis